jgi:hypothetical protein
MIPEWMESVDSESIKNNGVWTNKRNIPELMATYMKVWLEDNLPSELLDIMENDKVHTQVRNKSYSK